MKKFVCLLCVLILSSMGCMEVYAGSELTFSSTADLMVSPDDGTKPGTEKTTRVLIVGNSFSRTPVSTTVTYSVEKPLVELAAGEGRSMEVTTLAHGGAKLSYYAGMNESYSSYYKELVTLLVDGDWDYVIFQEQTTGPIEHFEDLMAPAVERLQHMVKLFQPEATMLLYMNAAFSDGKKIDVNGTPKLLTTGEMELYLAAAFKELEHRYGVEAVMVGMHSYRINLLYPEINLVRNDARHPTYAGYYLAACCFYNRIFGTLPNPLKANLTNCNITNDQLMEISFLPADSIVLDKKEISLQEGKTSQLQAKVTRRTPEAAAVTYQSFNPSVASVDPITGEVKAVGPGNTIVCAATPDGLQDFCSIIVKQPLSFAKEYYLAGKGDKILILPQTNQTNLKWSVGNKAVATVDASTGLVTVKASGKTTITVKNKDDSTDTASYVLYVTCDTPTGIKVSSTGNPASDSKFGNLKVTWNAVDRASGYDIYRATTKNGTYQWIGTSSKASYTDKTAAVNKYYNYKIVAKNAYSECSSPMSVSARGIILKAPTVKVSLTSKKYTKLTWKKNTRATGYIIYSSAKKNSGYKEIARITSKSKTTYTDKSVKIKKNVKRYYRVKAYRVLDKNEYSGIKSQKMKISG